MVPNSLYLHIPFCVHRCGYCDFNTYAGLEALIPAYVGALRAEARQVAASAGERLPLHTVFFGGGTPSLLPVEALAGILETVAEAYDLLPGAEISLEANPGTVDLDYLRALRGLGVNRLSLGMQSAIPEELRLLERQHDYAAVVAAVEAARQAGFENLSLDLIFGLPEQPLENWAHSLELAIGLGPEHLSLYSLTIEEGTPFAHRVESGLMPEPDPDRAAEMYELAIERLGEAGHEHYEVSNWARRDGEGRTLACRHNLQYWRNQPYLGLGAGAHGYMAEMRIANVRSPAAYVQRCQKGGKVAFPCSAATVSSRRIDKHTEMQETMMLGLRLVGEGVEAGAFQARFGTSIEAAFPKELERLLGKGLVAWTQDGRKALRLTERGLLLGNQAFMEFV